MNEPIPGPIEPEGIFTGIHWGCVVRGAVLDLFLTFAAGIPVMLWLAGDAAFSEDQEAASGDEEQPSKTLEHGSFR